MDPEDFAPAATRSRMTSWQSSRRWGFFGKSPEGNATASTPTLLTWICWRSGERASRSTHSTTLIEADLVDAHDAVVAVGLAQRVGGRRGAGEVRESMVGAPLLAPQASALWTLQTLWPPEDAEPDASMKGEAPSAQPPCNRTVSRETPKNETEGGDGRCESIKHDPIPEIGTRPMFRKSASSLPLLCLLLGVSPTPPLPDPIYPQPLP